MPKVSREDRHRIGKGVIQDALEKGYSAAERKGRDVPKIKALTRRVFDALEKSEEVTILIHVPKD